MAEGLCRYYFFSSIIFLILTIYCANFHSTYKNDICILSEKFEPVANQDAQVNPQTDQTTVLVRTTKPAKNLTTIVQVLEGFYATEFVLCFLTSLLIFYFQSKLPKDFARMGRIKNCMGALLKIFPKLVILLHYVILILIAVQIGYIASTECKNTEDANGVNRGDKLFNLGIIMIIVMSALWFAMHVLGAVIKSLLYVDPFLVDPEDPTANKAYTILCQKLGP